MEHTNKTNHTMLTTMKDIKSLFPDKLANLLRHINRSSLPQHRKLHAIERIENLWEQIGNNSPESLPKDMSYGSANTNESYHCPVFSEEDLDMVDAFAYWVEGWILCIVASLGLLMTGSPFPRSSDPVRPFPVRPVPGTLRKLCVE